MNNKAKRNTVQKELVFQVFRQMKNHPSAGMVYEKLHEKYPNISRATVYRLLAEAADNGEILRVKISDGADRYDFTVAEHPHFRCRTCGGVFDIAENPAENFFDNALTDT